MNTFYAINYVGFSKFLKDNSVYTKFKNAFNKLNQNNETFDEFLYTNDPEYFIDDFIPYWDESEEGNDFWGKLNQLWLENIDIQDS